MSVTARNQPRQPKGVPTGGQWRPTGRPEAPVHLDEGPDDGERPAPRPIGAQARRYSPTSGGGLGVLADEGTRAQVTLAALSMVNADGPSEAPLEERVAGAAMRIAALLDEGSVVSRALASLSRCDKPFIGIPRRSELEESSNRRIVYFETTDRETGEVRTETLRTERVDDPLGKLIYEQARACKDRPVRIYKEVEDTGRVKDGHPVRVRVLRWVEPLPGQDGQPPT
jgi:hypothetical protein